MRVKKVIVNKAIDERIEKKVEKWYYLLNASNIRASEFNGLLKTKQCF